MAGEWLNALMSVPDAGARTMQGFNYARQMKQQEEDRRIQMQERQEDRQLRRDTLEAQQQKALLEQHRDKILMGAKIVRQFNPQDEASWQAARNAAAMAGIDLSDVPPNYNPQYVQGLISIADAMEKDNTPQPTSFMREAEYFGIPREDAAQLWRQRQGTVVINGVPHIMDTGGGAAPPVLTDDDILRMEGGQSGAGSAAGFLGPR